MRSPSTPRPRPGNARRRLVPALALALTCGLAPPAAAKDDETAPGALRLHVPSPDWRDQVLYFAMIDRFDNGDPRNDDQGAREFDPGSNAKYNGGDLAGLSRRLDYIRGLGATALWITPPVANQWWNDQTNYGGYHGYWAEDFSALDRHVGTLDEYRRLADGLHRAGMLLVQDIVVNHTGNYFHYAELPAARDPAQGYRVHPDSAGRTAPTQWPFTLNDPRRREDREAGIYHWTPQIRSYDDPRQVHTHQLGALDDLDTETPAVRTALRKSYGAWIRDVGVDAYRVDTAFYVPREYFRDFLDSSEPDAPGVLRVARATGREDFLLFGEGFATDRPYQDKDMRRIDAYQVGRSGGALPSMLNFPLYQSLGDVFGRGRPTAELGWRIRRMMELHAQVHRMPTFVDNHDVDRFLASGSEPALRQALLALMTLPGIPTLYYGTEQGYTLQRGAMFAAGYGAGGKDHFDTQSPLYRYIARSTALRHANRVFSRGTPTVLRSTAAGPGALAWRTDLDDHSMLVVFNTADHDLLLDNLETGKPAGTRWRGVFAIDGEAPDQVLDAKARLTLRLPARSGYVWRAEAIEPIATKPGISPTLDPLPGRKVRGDLPVQGTAEAGSETLLVIDGNLASATRARAGSDSRWRVELPTDGMIDPEIEHSIVAYAPATGLVSETRRFRVQREWRLLLDASDPARDDHGPEGRYQYPLDADFAQARPQDILGVRAHGSGGALKLDLKLNRLVSAWNAPNGFDHVACTLFFEVPGAGEGSTVLPLQHATLPQGMRWHYRLRLHGWSNVWYSATGASADSEGTVLAPAPALKVDRKTQTLQITVPASALGGLRSLSGVKVYVTTWDYDGGFRALAAKAAQYGYGGGDGAREPLIMDQTAVLVLP